jgi:hypothetical protein
MRNAEPHQNRSSNAPPMMGPAVMPPMKQASQMLIACPICSGRGNMCRISAIVEGMSVAPATPRRARAAISISGLWEYAASTDTAPNAVPPTRRSRRLPIRSASPPMVTSNPASRNE